MHYDMNQTTREQLEILNQQIKEIIGLYREAIKGEVSDNEFWIWYTLMVIDGEYSQQDICNAWSMSKQTVNTIIMHMVQKGFITLEVVPGTRNRKIICLTDDGKEYGERIVKPIAEGERRAYEKLSLEDKAAFFNTLSKYIDALKAEFNI